MPKRAWFMRHLDILLLVGVLLLLLSVLAVRGLDLGYIGDVLNVDYHFERYGLWQGTHWLVADFWARHLLGGIYGAATHYLFPGSDAAWYALALATHYVAAVTAYLLVRSLFSGRIARLLGWLSAVIFAVALLDIPSNFEFPSIISRNLPLAFAWLSLLLYARYRRGGRSSRMTLHVSFALYVAAFTAYEQSALFFLLYPVIAFFEASGRRSPCAFVRELVEDLFLFPVSVAVYVYVLLFLFPGRGGFSFSPAWILQQWVDGLRALFDPTRIAGQISGAVGESSLAVFVLLVLFVSVGVWLALRNAGDEANEERSLLGAMVLGALASLVTIASASLTAFNLATDPRLLYPALFSAPLLILSLIAWGAARLRVSPLGHVLIAVLAASLIVAGGFSLINTHSRYQSANLVRQQSLAALRQAVPEIVEPARPYFLVVTNAVDPDSFQLNMRDINFPFLLDRLYGVDGLMGDGVYLRSEGALAADETTTPVGAIIADEDGIHSPLRPGEIIDPDRLVVVFYDVDTGTVRVHERLPEEVLTGSNIVDRVGLDWATNWSQIRVAEGSVSPP
ncbi:MAG: hypothetical protein IPK19_35580 [Chloroflexi bacterium]|nr:hypothetical protein [Chloroflexota bacterium]